MAVIKCKMCGGDLELVPDTTVCECEYCGTRQTVPATDDEKKLKLFERANRLRRACEFDKAASVYESIVADFDTEAEAYWGLVLCKFGIEYVDDPATGKKVPTCHRAGFESIEDDANFEQACENADAVARRVYREEGRVIDELRERIIEVSGKEEPYDIFISYKELAEDGGRTEDSVLAQDIYDALTAKGYRVFFSRVTLEDKLGVEYEPYIFAALQSAKIMLLVGMDYENLNAVWVKNEWSRFLALMTKNKEKVLIPCYKDMDPYDLPKEVRKLAAQDMGKVGAMQDLMRGVEKLLRKSDNANNIITQNEGRNENGSDALVRRTRLFLAEKNWDRVKEYCERILDNEPEEAEAYWLKELADRGCSNDEELAELYYINAFSESAFIAYARKYANGEMKTRIAHYDDLLRQMPTIFEERRKNRKRDPEAQRKKAQLKEARAFADIIEKRFIASAGMSFGLREDGTVVTTRITDADKYYDPDNGRSAVSKWTDIKTIISPSITHMVGLKFDGTIVVTKDKNQEIDDEEFKGSVVSKWAGIKEIYDHSLFIHGLAYDGSVYGCINCEEEYVAECCHGEEQTASLKSVSSILLCDDHLVCRTTDGSIIITDYLGNPENDSIKGIDEILNWKNVKSIIPGVNGRTVGIKDDGTLIATRRFDNGKHDFWPEFKDWTDVSELVCTGNCVVALTDYGDILHTSIMGELFDRFDHAPFKEIFNWTDIVKLYWRHGIIQGLKLDGTVASTSYQAKDKYWEPEQLEAVSSWKNIVGLSGVCSGITRDGRVKYSGRKNHGQENVSHFKLFSSPAQLMESIKEKEMEAGKKKEYSNLLETINKKFQSEYESAASVVEQKYSERKAQVDEEFRLKTAAANKEKSKLESMKKELENIKSGLGLFKSKEKRELSDQIDKISAQLVRIPSDGQIREEYHTLLDELSSNCMDEVERIRKEVEKKYPTPSFQDFLQG